MKKVSFLSSIVAKVGKRIPYYFVMASLCIWPLAALQLSLINRMPIWNVATAESKLRVLECYTVQQEQLSVVQCYKVEQRAKQPFYLSMHVSDTQADQRRVEYACVGSIAGRISPDARLVALADNQHQLTIKPLDKLELESPVLLTCNSRVHGMVWSPDSTRMLVYATHEVTGWDCKHNCKLDLADLDPNLLVVTHPAAEHFVAGINKRYHLFSWSGKVERSLPIDPRARSIAISADLQLAAVVVDQELSIINLMTGQRLLTDEFKLPLGSRQVISFSPVGKRLAIIHSPGATALHKQLTVLNVEGDLVEPCYDSALAVSGIQFATFNSVWAWNLNGYVELVEFK
jgi:hypothetical protein